MSPAPRRVLAQHEMARVVKEYGGRYRKNSSLRAILPNGFGPCETTGLTVDPPGAAQVVLTRDFLATMTGTPGPDAEQKLKQHLRQRELTMIFTGTANAARNDSEHPWPGYLTLLDILYLRESGPHLRNELATSSIAYLEYPANSSFPGPTRMHHPRPPSLLTPSLTP